MTVRAVSPVSPHLASTVDSAEVSSGYSIDSELMSDGDDGSGCLCFSCGDPTAAQDQDFLYLFRPLEGHTITLCERSNGGVTEHRLQRIHFGNTRYLRQFLKPDLHHRPLKFDVGQLCRDHQRGWCQRGPMCRFIHICRKLPLKAPSPYTQFANNTEQGAEKPLGRFFPSPFRPAQQQPSPSSSPSSSPTPPPQLPTNFTAQPPNLPDAQTMQSLLAALQQSMSVVPNQQPLNGLYTAPSPSSVNQFTHPSLAALAAQLNVNAPAYTPISFTPSVPSCVYAPIETPHVMSHVAPTTPPEIPNTTMMPNQQPTFYFNPMSNNVMASSTPSYTASGTPQSSATSSLLPDAPTTSTVAVPASIANIWKIPTVPSTHADDTTLQSLRNFASAFGSQPNF